MYICFYADWTTPRWIAYIKPSGYANINYSLQETVGALISIG